MTTLKKVQTIFKYSKNGETRTGSINGNYSFDVINEIVISKGGELKAMKIETITKDVVQICV